jgi:hypothetical protein
LFAETAVISGRLAGEAGRRQQNLARARARCYIAAVFLRAVGVRAEATFALPLLLLVDGFAALALLLLRLRLHSFPWRCSGSG